MAARNVFGGLASLFLMLAKIILCLLFAVFDRVVKARSGRGAACAGDERTPRPALET